MLYAVPAIGEKAYAYLHGDLRLSNVAILFLTLCVPVMAGMFAIFVADMMICRNVLQETRAMYRNGNRGGGENAAGAALNKPARNNDAGPCRWSSSGKKTLACA